MQWDRRKMGCTLVVAIVAGVATTTVTAEETGFDRRSVSRLRSAGLAVFATPFTKARGYGDGPVNASDPLVLGGRPTLQDNGTYLRVNGLDAQACAECHSLVSTTRGIVRLGIGGFGGISNAPMFMPRRIDPADESGAGFATFDGRLIVPPHLFGSGGVQLLAKEMTADLQALRRVAQEEVGEAVDLVSKGVSFGRIVARTDGTLDTSEIEGIDPDLVVRPFGRKGEFPSVHAFDLAALQFHLGIQPTEVVGEGVDADGDGVSNEISRDEVFALEAFITMLPRPRQWRLSRAGRRGSELFNEIGCEDCHRRLATTSRVLAYASPEVPTEPFANVHYEVDLGRASRFRTSSEGGLQIDLFSDLKRHDIGARLAESFHAASATQNREFVTAKLWGVGDSAPYLHDGRAQTLSEAIELHGGEAEPARDAFVNLRERDRADLLAFLGSLRLPQGSSAIGR